MSDEQQDITNRIDESLRFLAGRNPTDDGNMQKWIIKMIYSMCRAREHGRLTKEQKHSLNGILRNHRRTIREAQRTGRYVPPLVITESEKSMPKKRPRDRPT
jgi:hypothetical protein